MKIGNTALIRMGEGRSIPRSQSLLLFSIPELP